MGPSTITRIGFIRPRSLRSVIHFRIVHRFQDSSMLPEMVRRGEFHVRMKILGRSGNLLRTAIMPPWQDILQVSRNNIGVCLMSCICPCSNIYTTRSHFSSHTSVTKQHGSARLKECKSTWLRRLRASDIIELSSYISSCGSDSIYLDLYQLIQKTIKFVVLYCSRTRSTRSLRLLLFLQPCKLLICHFPRLLTQ